MIEEIKSQCSSALEFDIDNRRRSDHADDSTELPQTYIDYVKVNNEKEEMSQQIDEAQNQKEETVVKESQDYHNNNILISIEQNDEDD